MKETEFNLLDEPWIKLIDNRGIEREVSLREALINAHEYVDISGETATQNAAVLRLLLAVLFTVFCRFDAKGDPAPIADEDDAFDRIEQLWQLRSFPEEVLHRYFDLWHERFWLFHPTNPFGQMQALNADAVTLYKASKLNGEISESNNKLRIFSSRSGEGKELLSFAESARWLIFLLNYDDTSAKNPTPKTGWMGKCGIVYALGGNLFETLMLNLTLLSDGETVWGEPKPSWEDDAMQTTDANEIAIPNNPARLYSLKYRFILLMRNGTSVDSYKLKSGYYFDGKNAFHEQMTVWRKGKSDGGADNYTPRRCEDIMRQMWRDFGNDYFVREDNHLPGVVTWIEKLKELSIIDELRSITFRTVSAVYSSAGIKDSSIADLSSDSLTFHTELLTEAGIKWRARIDDEIGKCDKLAELVAALARNIELADGGSGEASFQAAKSRLYFAIDEPFRRWLLEIDPKNNLTDADEHCLRWQQQARAIGMKLGRELVQAASETAFVGRTVTYTDKGGNDKTLHYSAPKAFNIFTNQLYKLYPREEEG